MATPNMNLTLPVVGVTAGPAYASQINAALTVVDGHDHTSGSGSQITPAALNINADLTVGSNNLTDTRSVRFTAQGSALAGASPDLACIYVVGDNLYYNDGIGNQIAITASGSIAGATGNITGLVAPASVTYTSGGSPNYKFMSSATASANLDAASVLMRNPGVTATYALTLQAPTLASNYSITLPAAPAAAAFLQMDSSGVITAAPAMALGITSANLAADAVTTTKITDLAVTGAKIANSTIAVGKLSWLPTMTTTNYTSNTTAVVPANVSTILISGIGGGGGAGDGGSGSQAGGGSGGASGYFLTSYPVTVTPGETLTITIGAGGATGGFAGGNSSVSGTFGTVTIYGGPGGNNGVGSTGGGQVVPGVLAGLTAAAGGAGGNGAVVGLAGSTGQASIRALGTPGMAGFTTSGGGGGGGGGLAFLASASGGNNGSSGVANTGTGGQGGSGLQFGGAGGSGLVQLTYVPTS